MRMVKLLCVACQQERGSKNEAARMRQQRLRDYLCLGVEGKVAPPSKSYTATARRMCIMSAQLRSTPAELIMT